MILKYDFTEVTIQSRLNIMIWSVSTGSMAATSYQVPHGTGKCEMHLKVTPRMLFQIYPYFLQETQQLPGVPSQQVIIGLETLELNRSLVSSA